MLASMDERSRVLLSALLGAALGGVAGYLYLTERGRYVRGQIEPTLDSIVTELEKARTTGEKVREVAREGQRTLNDLVGEDRARSAWESTKFRQASS
jgi:gas vesicle protein